MALNKVTYIARTTPVSSQNLNDIQDEIINNMIPKDTGGTFDADITINDKSTTTSSEVSMLMLGNSTATGTVGNSNGLIRMYGQGDKYVNLRPITGSGSYTSANRTIYLPDASGTIQLVENHTVVNGSLNTTNIPSGSVTTIATMSLTSGTWVIVGAFEFTTSFSEGAGALFSGVNACTTRGTGTNGGGFNLTCIEVLSSTTTVGLQTYQSSSSAKSVRNILLRAVKIA